MNTPQNISHPTTDICVPLQPSSLKELEASIQKATEAGATMLEVWLDHLPEEQRNPEAIRNMTGLKLLGVCKPRGAKERGMFEEIEKERIQVLRRCIAEGFNMIDMGLSTTSQEDMATLLGVANLHNCAREEVAQTKRSSMPSTQVSVSWHTFNATGIMKLVQGSSQNLPNASKNEISNNTVRAIKAALMGIIDQIKSHHPHVHKIAAQVADPKVIQAMIETSVDLKEEGSPAILLPMGDWSWYRMLAPELGAPFTFTTIDEARATTTTGQITITQYQKAREQIEQRGIDAPSLANVPQELRASVELLLEKAKQS